MAQLDFYIDPATGDLDFSNGLRLTEVGGEAVAQKVNIRLRFFFGEWRLYRSQGTKWFETVLTKSATDYNINQEIQRRVLDTEGVRAIEDYKFSRDNPKRSFECSFRILTDNDDTAEITIEDIGI